MMLRDISGKIQVLSAGINDLYKVLRVRRTRNIAKVILGSSEPIVKFL